MNETVTEIFFYVANCILFFQMQMGLVLTLRPRWKHAWLPFVSYLLYFSALYPFSYAGNPFVSVGMMAGVVVTAVVFYTGRVGERILLSSIFLIASLLTDYAIDAAYVLFGIPFETHQDQVSAMIIVLILYTMLVLLIANLWNRFKRNNSDYSRNREIAYFSIFPLTQILSSVCITYFWFCTKFGFNEAAYNKVIWSVVFALATIYTVSDILLFRAIRQNAQNVQLKEQIKLLESKNAWEIEHNKIILQKEAEISRLRHDFINVVQLLKLGASDGKTDRLLADLEQELDKTRTERICANGFVNIILSERRGIAAQKDIDLETDVQVGEYESVSDLDLSRIFINIADNALDAAETVPAASRGDRRFVRISAGERSGYLVIKCSNSYDGTIYKYDTNAFRTRKQQGNDHGLGLSIIKGIAEKYGGALLIDYTESVFTITVTLKL